MAVPFPSAILQLASARSLVSLLIRGLLARCERDPGDRTTCRLYRPPAVGCIRFQLWATTKHGILGALRWPMLSLHRLVLYSTWISPVILQGIILAATLARRLYRDFPMFVTYTAFEIVFALSRLAADLDPAVSYGVFFYLYWLGNAIEVVLSFAVIYEIFSQVFRSYEALRKLGLLLFRWSVVVLAMLAVVSAASEPSNDASRLIGGLVVLQRSLSVVQCGLLLLLFLFASYFGLTWRHYVFGIALGFGILGTAQLAIASLRTHFGPNLDTAYSLVLPIAYNCSVLVWVTYLLRPEGLTRTAHMLPNHDLAEWNDALRRLLLQ